MEIHNKIFIKIFLIVIWVALPLCESTTSPKKESSFSIKDSTSKLLRIRRLKYAKVVLLSLGGLLVTCLGVLLIKRKTTKTQSSNDFQSSPNFDTKEEIKDVNTHSTNQKKNFGFGLAFSDAKEDGNVVLFTHEEVHQREDSTVNSTVVIKQNGQITWDIEYRRTEKENRKTVDEFQLFYTFTRGKNKSFVFSLSTPFIQTYTKIPYKYLGFIKIPFKEYQNHFHKKLKMVENSYDCKQIKYVTPSIYWKEKN